MHANTARIRRLTLRGGCYADALPARQAKDWSRYEFWFPAECKLEIVRTLNRIIRAHQAKAVSMAPPPEKIQHAEPKTPAQQASPASKLHIITSDLETRFSGRSFPNERAAQRAVKKQAFNRFRKAGLADAFKHEWPAITKRLKIPGAWVRS